MPYVIAVAVSFVVSLIICSALKSGMKNVEVKEEAFAYSADGLRLTHQLDRYTHTTRTRTRIQSEKK